MLEVGAFGNIVERSSLAFVLHRPILDSQGLAIDQEILDANAAFEGLVASPRQGLLGLSLGAVLPGLGEASPAWLEACRRIGAGGGDEEIEVFLPSLARGYRLHLFPAGRGDCLTSFSPLKLEESASLSSIQEYFDAAPLGLLIFNGEGEYVDANPAACGMLGYAKDELLSMSVPDLVSPGSEEGHWAAFSSFKAKGRASGEVQLRASDGRKLEMMTHSIGISGGRYLSFLSDLSGQRKAERKEGLYHNAMESLEQAVIIADLNGSIMEVNRAFCDLYGYTRAEVLGAKPRILNPGRAAYLDLGYTAEEYDDLFKGMWAVLKDPRRRSWKGRVVNRRKNGSLLWASLLIDKIQDGGKVVGFVGLPFDISDSIHRERLSKVELYSTIASLADLRDNETGSHMKRVGIFSKLVAKSAGMPRQYCEDMELFAPMHDIGKVGILDAILLADRKLTAPEFEEMKKHTILGHNIVKGKKELELVSAITLHHHERWDGGGYPMGLSEEDIPLSARITAIADIYDALRSAQPYKRAWSHVEAVEEIRSIGGSHLHPVLVGHFLRLASSFERIFDQVQ